MSNFVLALILIGGVALLFATGWLVSRFTRLDKEYMGMMEKGGTIPNDDSDRVPEKTQISIR